MGNTKIAQTEEPSIFLLRDKVRRGEKLCGPILLFENFKLLPFNMHLDVQNTHAQIAQVFLVKYFMIITRLRCFNIRPDVDSYCS
jgi:hypothetical protein